MMSSRILTTCKTVVLTYKRLVMRENSCEFCLLFLLLLRAVHVTDFTSDRYQIVTGSDDYTCRLWDIPNATELSTYQEHTDYIRCGVTSKLNRDLFITGEMEATFFLKWCKEINLLVHWNQWVLHPRLSMYFDILI